MTSFAIRKCVSLGGIGTVAASPPNDPIADLAYGNNAGDLTRTSTPWVRLFAQWDIFATAPTSLHNPNDRQFAAMALDLDTDIAAAKRISGQKVVLTTRGFPSKWVPDEGPQSGNQYSFPQAQYLQPSVSRTPQPLDGPYAQWVMYLLDRYHPGNTRGPVIRGQRASIDYFEVVNEPNYEIGPGPVAAARTALMFNTALGIAISLNAKYGATPAGAIRLLGPATADSTHVNTAHPDYRTFTSDLLDQLTALGFDTSSQLFGWSHHNYVDVEQIARVLSGMSAATVASLVASSRQTHQQSPDAITPMDQLYGPSTQNVRSILSGRWHGWGTSGQQPQLWLTEGGARLNAGDVHGDTQLQATAVSIAAEVLATHRGGTASQPQPGQGVEMFTNFLLYSESGADSGLRDSAASGGAKRPVFDKWTQFHY